MNKLKIYVIFYFASNAALTTVGDYYAVGKGKRATAKQTANFSLKYFDQTKSSHVCLQKCNQNTACTTANVYNSGICEVTLSQIVHVLPVNGVTMYQKRSRRPKGFGHLTAWGRPYSGGWMVPSWYKFSLKKMKWQTARQHCATYGGDLVSVETEEEHRHIESIFLKMGFKGHWFTSGTDVVQEGVWYWKATGTPLNFTAWIHKTPDINSTFNCMRMVKFEKRLVWDDEDCDYRKYFVCELPGF